MYAVEVIVAGAARRGVAGVTLIFGAVVVTEEERMCVRATYLTVALPTHDRSALDVCVGKKRGREGKKR